MSYQEKVRNLPHYQEALKILFEHESAKELLGTPIKVAHIDLGDRRNNYVGKLESKLLVPISGAINSGLLNIYADRPSIEDQFKAKKIRLELEEESILVYERDS
uniref:Uncharacterized protein n=1 Tax=Acrobeloides nanus TaxID=290746 RepID=A0A914D1Y0_9BILA